MSFKIFTLQLFGGLKSIETIEKKRQALFDDFSEFQRVENSDELKRYLELEKEINSSEFKKKKSEIESLSFKGSNEFNQLKEFAALQKKKSLKNYFKIEGSSELDRYNKLNASVKMEEYFNLLKYVNEGQLAREKKEILSQVFKGSAEQKQWAEFNKLNRSKEIKVYRELHQSESLKRHETFATSEKLKNCIQLAKTGGIDKEKQKELKTLKNDSDIRSYLSFEKSKKLKIYRECINGSTLKRYHELQSVLESDEFKNRVAYLKDKNKFEKSEAGKKFKRFKELEADNDVKFYVSFEKSGLFKNYNNVAKSSDLKRYIELDEIIKSDEFKARKAYLEDNKKWEKTEEYAHQQEFLAMQKIPHLVKYFKHKGTTVFKFFDDWKLVFEDDFSKPHLDAEKWSTKHYLAEKHLGDNYSLAGDNHVFTDGKNIKLNGKLSIEVKKEKAVGKVWQLSSGFIPAELDYTSGIISTWKNFWIEDGIVEAKIKFNPVEQVVSSLYLTGEQHQPRVNLLEMGTKNRVGILKLNGGKAEVNGMDISNLKKGDWYIFSVEKKGNNFTWKINESEILTLQSNELKDNMHINASSIVVNDIPVSNLPAGFDIEWVKCYRRN